MHDELSEPLRMEMFAASLRADNTDVKAFLEALATKLEGALPGQTTVTRQGGMFAREHPVKEIAVSLGDYQYRIGRDRQGPLIAQRAKIVRGIVLKTEQIPVEQWIDELSEALVELAGQSTQARAALERFLL
ncbi:MAG TPA: hypothetical protein VFA09_21075 [Ktedonobacteraceae bacterium]|jgi:hypothetical protein|nr:hypothetical protein [Ktedonobacteraceae bacterium]